MTGTNSHVTTLLLTGLPIVLGVVMIVAGAVNVAGAASVRASFARWGYPSGFHRVTGGIEVVAGLLLLVPATTVVGAALSAIVLLCAAVTLVRHRDFGHLPGAALLAAASIATLLMHS